MAARNTSGFRVEIGGVVAGYFKGVDGLSAEAEVIEEMTPGRVKWQPITLKKGYIDSSELYDHQARSKWQPITLKKGYIYTGEFDQKAGGSETLMQAKSAVRLVLHDFVLDQAHKTLLQHWASPGAPRTTTAQGQIVMIDSLGNPVRRWQFYEAWPCKWYVPELDSDSSSGSSVELAVGKLVRL